MTKYSNEFELNTKTFNLFNFDKFRKFVIKHNIIPLSMSIPIGYIIKDFIMFLINEIIFPYLDKFTKINKIKNKFVYDVDGISVNFGLLIYKVIHTVILIYFIFFISRLFKDIIN